MCSLPAPPWLIFTPWFLSRPCPWPRRWVLNSLSYWRCGPIPLAKWLGLGVDKCQILANKMTGRNPLTGLWEIIPRSYKQTVLSLPFSLYHFVFLPGLYENVMSCSTSLLVLGIASLLFVCLWVCLFVSYFSKSNRCVVVFCCDFNLHFSE